MVRWVEGDVGEVAMQVYNPMPFDIKISKMVSCSSVFCHQVVHISCNCLQLKPILNAESILFFENFWFEPTTLT